jgi:hypothetical protein
MGINVWLDDVRRPPFGYDIWVKTVAEVIEKLELAKTSLPAGGGVILPKSKFHTVHISLDHDLTEQHYEDAVWKGAGKALPIDRSRYAEPTGLAVIEWMAKENVWVPSIWVHTLNERGSADMLDLLMKKAPRGVWYKKVTPTTAYVLERT